MWERFTERAKHVVTTAREEATRLGSEYVRTEHILLGLCDETDGIAACALVELGVNIDTFAAEVERHAQRGNSTIAADKIAFTPRAKKVLELAVEEARGFNHKFIGAEHILLGLLKEEEGIAAKILSDMNVTAERVRKQVFRHMGPDYTSASRQALEMAVKAARQFNHEYIGTEHILLGLISTPEGIAISALRNTGMDLDRTREEIIRLINESNAQS